MRFAWLAGKFLKTWVLGVTSKAVDNVIPLMWQLEKDIEAGVSGKANVLIPKCLCKKAIKYGLRGPVCVRWEIKIPGTFSATSTKGMRRGYIDSKGSTIG